MFIFDKKGNSPTVKIINRVEIDRLMSFYFFRNYLEIAENGFVKCKTVNCFNSFPGYSIIRIKSTIYCVTKIPIYFTIRYFYRSILQHFYPVSIITTGLELETPANVTVIQFRLTSV